jgi:hypothetical protein
MRLYSAEFEHPTQASRTVLNVYEETPARNSPAAETDTRGVAGYLVTEDRIGARKVVATLGFYATREEALTRVQARAAELQHQRYRPVTPAA